MNFIEDKELKKLLIEQQKHTTTQIESLKKYVDKKFAAVDQKIDQSFADAQEQTNHQLQGMQEHYDWKIAGVMELVEDIPPMKAKLDLTFDKVGDIAVDVEMIKTAVKENIQDIAKLKAR